MAFSRSFEVLSLLSLLFTPTLAHSHGQDAYATPPPWRGTGKLLDKRATYTYSGCYSSSTGITFNNSWQFQSNDYCAPICTAASQAVFGFQNGGDCWCGNLLPPANSKVDDSNCNIPCFGYGADYCGGTGFYSVFLTGTQKSVANADSSSSSSSSSSTSSSSTSTTTGAGKTATVTAPGTANSNDATSSSSAGGGGKTNTAGIAAGVVVGVLVVGALIAGAIFYVKNKKKKQAEEEFKRTQVSDFMRNRGAAEPKPLTTPFASRYDQRLDPEAGARRNSFGSIADDQDYSRRILRVANPDDN